MRYLLVTLVLATMVIADAPTFFYEKEDFAPISRYLIFEDFSNAQGATGTFSTFPGPLNCNTDNIIFPLNSVAPGFSIGETGSPYDHIEVLMPEAMGNSNVLVGTRFSATGLTIDFDIPVNAFECNVSVYWDTALVNIQVFGVDGEILGSSSAYTPPGDGSFMGIYTGNERISQVVFFAPGQPHPPSYNGQFLSCMMYGSVAGLDQALSHHSWAAIKYSF